jgi:hypothetical protein
MPKEACETSSMVPIVQGVSTRFGQESSSGPSGHVEGDPGGLDVCREAAVAPDQLGLACIGKRHELDGGVAANLSHVCDDGQRLEAAALADAGIGRLHGVVGLLERGLVCVEGIAVLHDELAAPHEAEPGAHLVAELRLDLVEGDG